MSGIKTIVKDERDGYYAPLYRLLGMSRALFWQKRTHWHGKDFSPEDYQAMADYLNVSVAKLKGQENAIDDQSGI